MFTSTLKACCDVRPKPNGKKRNEPQTARDRRLTEIGKAIRRPSTLRKKPQAVLAPHRPHQHRPHRLHRHRTQPRTIGVRISIANRGPNPAPAVSRRFRFDRRLDHRLTRNPTTMQITNRTIPDCRVRSVGGSESWQNEKVDLPHNSRLHGAWSGDGESRLANRRTSEPFWTLAPAAIRYRYCFVAELGADRSSGWECSAGLGIVFADRKASDCRRCR